MVFIYFLLLINLYYVLSFNNLVFGNKLLRQKKTTLFLNNNKYNNIYLNKNNYRVLHTSTYLETLEKKEQEYNQKLIAPIIFDDIILYNNYIDVVYDNKNNYLIIEFKNSSRFVYHYNNNYLHINEIIKNVDYVNLNHYPTYIINSPFAFFVFEKKNNNKLE